MQQQVLKPGQVVLEYLYVSPEDQLTPPADSSQPPADSSPPKVGSAGELIIFCLPWEGELSVAQVPLPQLPDGKGFDSWLMEQLGWLYSASTAAPGVERRAAAQRALYDLLLAPVAQAIPASGPDGAPVELIICPDHQLYTIPYEALLDAGGSSCWTSSS